jgi:hypothetical protein
MGIRDRGKMKWRSAFFIPEQVKMLRDARRDDLKIEKPLLDEYQIEEFEQNIHLAMEFTYQVIIKVWKDGFFYDYSGTLHRLDEINKLIYLELEDETKIKLCFDNVVDVKVKE